MSLLNYSEVPSISIEIGEETTDGFVDDEEEEEKKEDGLLEPPSPPPCGAVACTRKDLIRARRSNSALEVGMMVYKMTANPRGLAMIINIENFDNDVMQKRDGSPKDVENLEKLFRHLQFTVIVKNNLTKRELMLELQAFSANEAHARGDMMILAILSHGKNGHVYSSEGAQVSTEWIYEQFNNQYCPLLIGKPKFFIMQACRGKETDRAQAQAQALENHYHTSRKRRPSNSTVDNDACPFGSGGSNNGSCWDSSSSAIGRARPTWEDMIIAYSTIPGYASIRDHEQGTWFIMSLCETFFKYAHENMLIDLLMMTSQKLSEFTNEKNEKQTCNIELRHMYKRLYFNSDLSVASSSLIPPQLARSLSTPPTSPKRMDDEDDE